MATNSERRTLTCANLIEAANELFTLQGYESTSTESLLERAGVSRGAMYHHFATKKALFEAVFISVSKDAITHAQQQAREHSSPMKALQSASIAWLQVVKHPKIGSILLAQGPQVLGWKRTRDLEAELSLKPMTLILNQAVSAGEIRVTNTELTARLINAILAETALAGMYSETPHSYQDLEKTVCEFIQALTNT